MKKMGWFGWMEAVGLAVLMLALSVQATSFNLVPLGIEDMARYHATHVLDVNYKDWVGYTTSTNTTAVNTNALNAGTMIRFVMMKLDSAWDCATYTDSLLLYSGWAADTDGFFVSTEVAKDGTEVFAAVTTLLLEQGNYGIGGTNTITNITYQAHGWQYFATATNILTTFKQNSHGSCISSNTQGRVRLFFDIVTP